MAAYSFGIEPGNVYKSPPLASTQLGETNRRARSPAQLVSGIIPNSGGLMFVLPSYDEAGSPSNKKSTGGAGSKINVSVPTARLAESPLPNTSSVHNMQIMDTETIRGNKRENILPDWEERAGESDNYSSPAPSSTGSDHSPRDEGVVRPRKKFSTKKVKRTAPKRSAKKKSSPILSGNSIGTRAANLAGKTKKKISIISRKKKLKSRSPSVGRKNKKTTKKVEDDKSGEHSGSSLFELAASKTDEWYDPGAPEDTKPPATTQTRGKTQTRMHQLKHGNKSANDTSPTPSTPVIVESGQGGDATRTVTIHRSGTVEITTSAGKEITAEAHSVPQEGTTEAKPSVPQTAENKPESISSDDSGGNDSYEVLHDFWQKRREILSNLDAKYLVHETNRGVKHHKLTAADRWRKSVGVDEPRWEEEEPQWKKLQQPGWPLGYDANAEFLSSSQDVGDFLDHAIHKEHQYRRDPTSGSALIVENKRLKIALGLQEEKFNALEREWRQALETTMTSPSRKGKRRDVTNLTTTTPKRTASPIRVEIEKTNEDIEASTTTWLRWLRECVNVKAERIQSSSAGVSNLTSTTTTFKQERAHDDKKFDDISSVSDAESVSKTIIGSGGGHFFGDRAPPPPLPPALQQSTIGPEASALERACVALIESVETKEQMRRTIYRKSLKRSRAAVVKTRQDAELQYNTVLDKLKEEHEENLKKLRDEVKKAEERTHIAESHAQEHHVEEVRKFEREIEDLKEHFKNVKEVARQEAEYDVYSQRSQIERAHRETCANMQRQLDSLKAENEKFRQREADLDVAGLKVRMETAERIAKEATQRANEHKTRSQNLESTLESTTRAVKEEARVSSIRLREEHGIRMNAMRVAHEEQLASLQKQVKSLKNDQETVIRRVQTEHTKRMMEAVKNTRLEASRNIAAARTEFEALNESQLTQMRAIHRVEIKRLQRQLSKATNGEWTPAMARGGSAMENTSVQGDLSADERGIVLDGVEPSGIDLLNLQPSFDISDKSSGGDSSGEDVPVEKMSINDMKAHIVHLRQLLKRAQQTVRKEQIERKKVESDLKTARKQRDSALRKAKAWADGLRLSDESFRIQPSSREESRSPSRKKKGNHGANNRNKSGVNTSEEDSSIQAEDQDVTHNVFLSPNGTVERKKLFRARSSNREDEGSLPSVGSDEEEPRDATALAQLDRYMSKTAIADM